MYVPYCKCVGWRRRVATSCCAVLCSALLDTALMDVCAVLCCAEQGALLCSLVLAVLCRRAWLELPPPRRPARDALGRCRRLAGKKKLRAGKMPACRCSRRNATRPRSLCRLAAGASWTVKNTTAGAEAPVASHGSSVSFFSRGGTWAAARPARGPHADQGWGALGPRGSDGGPPKKAQEAPGGGGGMREEAGGRAGKASAWKAGDRGWELLIKRPMDTPPGETGECFP